MIQPEIAFVNKLIRIRLAAERLGGNRKPGVVETANWLKLHIKANGYVNPNESRSFFERHLDKIEYLIPSGKPKLREEFANLHKVSFQASF